MQVGDGSALGEVEVHDDWRDYCDVAYFHVAGRKGEAVMMRRETGKWKAAGGKYGLAEVSELAAILLLREGPDAVEEWCRKRGGREGG